jgi:prophage maintenance system killer protein
MNYLTVEQVLEIHEHALKASGGEPGVRDQGLLDSAVAQPRAGFGGKSRRRPRPPERRPDRPPAGSG